MKVAVIWDVALYGLVETVQHISGDYCLHYQDNE